MDLLPTVPTPPSTTQESSPASPPSKTPFMKSFSDQLNDTISYIGIDANSFFDNFDKLGKEVPQLLDNCYMHDQADRFSKNFSPVCIDDLSQFAKLFIRTLEDADNQIKLTTNILQLRKIFRNKVSKDCVFLQDVDTSTSQKDVNMINCSKWSVIFSLAVKNFNADTKNDNYSALAKDTTELMNKFPSLLYACGQPQFANFVEEWMPEKCSQAASTFLSSIIEASDKMQSWQWIYSSLPKVYGAFGVLETSCPYFK